MDTYRAAIIGLGFIGAADQVSGDAIGQQVKNLDGTHVEAYENHPRVEIVAGSSRDEGRRQRFADRTGARTYASWQELLAAERPDIVSVATYAPVHAQITIACAEAGCRAVYCEKPIATTIADAEAMISACDRHHTLLVINHNRRFYPNYDRLRDVIAEGKLGDLTSISLRWGKGRLGNVGTHLIDAACLIADARVAAVAGTLDDADRPDCRGEQFHDPGGWGLIRLTNGIMTMVDAADYAAGDMHIIAYGTKGRAVTGRQTVTLDFWDGGQDIWPDPDPRQTGMDRAVNQIVAALDGRAPLPHHAGMSAHILETIAAFHASHRQQGAWVQLPLSGTDRDIVVNSG